MNERTGTTQTAAEVGARTAQLESEGKGRGQVQLSKSRRSCVSADHDIQYDRWKKQLQSMRGIYQVERLLLQR